MPMFLAACPIQLSLIDGGRDLAIVVAMPDHAPPFVLRKEPDTVIGPRIIDSTVFKETHGQAA